MKKSILLTLALICIATVAVFAQDGTSEPGTSFSWPEIISYVLNGLMLLFSPKFVKVFNKIAQIKELWVSVADSLEDGNLSPSEQKGIAAKFKAVFGKA